MPKRTHFSFALLAGLFLTTVTYGQENRFELTPFVGYQFGGDIDAVDEFGPFSIDVENHTTFGLLLDFPVGRNLQVELLVNRQATELTLDEGLIGASFPIADADLTFYHGGLLFQLNLGQLKPFFVVTGGVTQIEPDLPQADDEFRLSISIGGGVKLLFTDHVGLRLEGRGYFTDASEEEFGCCAEDGDNDLFQGAVTAGLILRF